MIWYRKAEIQKAEFQKAEARKAENSKGGKPKRQKMLIRPPSDLPLARARFGSLGGRMSIFYPNYVQQNLVHMLTFPVHIVYSIFFQKIIKNEELEKIQYSW
jgi:hypothetical protein